MYALAFDTSLDKTYIALKDNENVKFEQILSDEKNYHSAYLISKIKQIGFSPEKLELIITNAGPGSFTGIRAGLSVAKVMAGQLNVPVVPLNSCEILLKASNLSNAVVLLDARRNMYYFYNGGEIELILKEDVKNKIKDSVVICDSGVVRDFGEELNNEFVNYEKQNYPLEQILLELGLQKFCNSKNVKEDFASQKLEANYIQTPPIFKH